MTMNTEDFHAPLPEPSRYWYLGMAGVITISWAAAFYALIKLGVI